MTQPNQWTLENDRRQHFRVQTQAILRWQSINAPTPEPAHLFTDEPGLSLLQQLQKIDEDTELLLQQLSPDDKAIGSCIRLINKKISLLSHKVTIDLSGKDSIQIDLSEGGLAFDCEQIIKPGQTLALALNLLPDQLTLICCAEVMYSLPSSASSPTQSFRTGCRFVDLQENQTLLLRRHTLECQARARRQSEEPAP